MAEKRKVIAGVLTTLVVAVVLAGGGAAAYNFIPEVKEAVDTITIQIKEKDSDKDKDKNKEKVQLAQVQNIAYDETNLLLTFSPVENATEYVITLTHLDLNKKYAYTTNSASCNIDLPSGTLTGHKLKFEIVARGGEDYKPSEKSTFEYEVQFESQKIYQGVSKNLYEFINQSLWTTFKSSVKLKYISSIKIENSNILITGNATDQYGKNYNFTLNFDCSNFNEEIGDINNILDFIQICKAVYNAKGMQISYVNTSGFVNVSEGLEGSELFTNYINEGYTITTVQQENSAVFDLYEGVKAFNVTGIYKLTAQGKETVTLQITQHVRLPENSNFTSDMDYYNYFNEGGEDITIIDGETTIFDSGIMRILYILESYKNGTNIQNQGSGQDMN